MIRLILLVSFFTLNSLYGQESLKTIDVSLRIKADKAVEDLLKSYLLKELRYYDDIKIKKEDEADFFISVICLKDEFDIYSASVNVLNPIRYKDVIDNIAFFMDMQNFEENRIKIDSSAIGRILRITLNSVEDNQLQILLTDNDLKSLSERIIASINVDIFEDKRILYDEILIDN